MEICIIRRTKKLMATKLLVNELWTVIFEGFLSHDTIQRLNCVVGYLNMKMKGTSAEIIAFQLFSSLKWYRVYKRGRLGLDPIKWVRFIVLVWWCHNFVLLTIESSLAIYRVPKAKIIIYPMNPPKIIFPKI